MFPLAEYNYRLWMRGLHPSCHIHTSWLLQRFDVLNNFHVFLLQIFCQSWLVSEVIRASSDCFGLMPPDLFPLRWESAGNRWWFASPIDWAAANGCYEVVKELLHLDPNLLIKLTSLPRTRRLEAVWDDQEDFADVAECRAKVARELLHESETKKGYKSLIRAGCAGWLLYTAAAAADMGFVKELLERDPLLVFGEGEYGVTDMLYAAARSKNRDVFMLVFDHSVAPLRRLMEEDSVFCSEMVNRAVHAAARGGGLEILTKLLDEYGDPLAFKDANGSTLLHSAAGKGHVQVVKHLISSYNIINSVDNRGNTGLHVAAFFGHYSVIELLLSASPPSASSVNNDGDTFLHVVFSSFGSPNFQRLDRQIALTKRLVSDSNNLVSLEEIINLQNKDGRTPVHVAAINDVGADIFDLIMSLRFANFFIRDCSGKTPLDLLKQQRASNSSERLMGMMTWNEKTRNAMVSDMRKQGSRRSSVPGTCFRIPDSEIFLYMKSGGYTSNSDEIRTPLKQGIVSGFSRSSSQLKKFLLVRPEREARSAYSSESEKSCGGNVVALRQQLSVPTVDKKMRSLEGDFGSPRVRSKFMLWLRHGVLPVIPKGYFESNLGVSSELRLRGGKGSGEDGAMEAE